MNRIVLYLLSIFLLFSCSTVKYVPVQTETKVNYVDSVRYNVRDSVVLIPKEVYHTYGDLLDTLIMETKYAKAEAYVDTLHNILNGHLESKATLEYRERIVYKDKIQYRDSIQIKEVPVPVEVVKSVTPKWAWYSLIGIIIETLILAAFIYFLFFKKIW